MEHQFCSRSEIIAIFSGLCFLFEFFHERTHYTMFQTHEANCPIISGPVSKPYCAKLVCCKPTRQSIERYPTSVYASLL